MNKLSIFATAAALVIIWLFSSLWKRNLAKSSTKIPELKLDEDKLKSCFPWSIYFLQSFEYLSLEYLGASVVCYGNLRGATDLAYKQIRANVHKVFGDQYLVLLEPRRNLSKQGQGFGEIRDVFVVTTNFNPPVLSHSERKSELILQLSSMLIVFLVFALTIVFGKFSGNYVGEIWQLIPIIIARELIRRWVGKHYGIKLSLPFFTGIVQPKSHIPHRQASFDLAIAPSLVSLTIGLFLVTAGLLLPASSDFSLEFNFKASLLISLLHQALAGFAPNSENLVHPLTILGWWCLNLTAISLIPFSILDGGWILRSMIGKTDFVAPIMRLVILILGLVSQQWLILVGLSLFLLTAAPPLVLDDATELNFGRDLIGFIVMGIGLAIILPVWR